MRRRGGEGLKGHYPHFLSLMKEIDFLGRDSISCEGTLLPLKRTFSVSVVYDVIETCEALR